MQQKKLKGLICGILENKEIGNCSNNGISNFHKDVLLVVDEPTAQVFEEDPARRPTVKVVRRIIGGKEYIHAEPIERPKAGNVGWMAGGSFIESSDSRFSRFVNQYPIALHDRQETQEEYDRLSI